MTGIKIKIMVACVVLVLMTVGVYMYRAQYKWSSEINIAIHKGDVKRIEELLKDTHKNVNIAGKSVRSFGKERPLEFACYCEAVDYRVVEMLVKHGAKAHHIDYKDATNYGDADMYEKVKLLISTGVKPKVTSSDGGDLLGNIALTYTSIGEDVYGIERCEWEKKITETYKLIYYNAEPFEKKAELVESLDCAKCAKNETLVAFIKSELEKMENAGK